MKTAMQFLLEKIENGDFLDHPKVIGEFIKYNLLEKEKEQIVNAWIDDRFPLDKEWVKQCAEKYYNETFNTKER